MTSKNDNFNTSSNTLRILTIPLWISKLIFSYNNNYSNIYHVFMTSQNCHLTYLQLHFDQSKFKSKISAIKLWLVRLAYWGVRETNSILQNSNLKCQFQIFRITWRLDIVDILKGTLTSQNSKLKNISNVVLTLHYSIF